MKNKKVILIVGFCVFALLFLAIGIKYQQNGADGHKLGGLRNPSNVLVGDPVSEDNRSLEYQNRPVYTEALTKEIKDTTFQKLSIGDFTGLDSYLGDVLNKYQTSPEDDDSPEGYLYTMRSDLANILGITKENGTFLLKSFQNPDALAAAMIYLPISEKYLAFDNLNSIVVPAVSTVDGTNQLVILTESTSNSDRLSKINSRNSNQFLAMKVYTMHLFEKEYEMVLVRNKNQCWEPFSLQPVDGNSEGLLDVLDVKHIADAIQGTGTSLDSMISYEQPSYTEDESSYFDR